MKVPPSGAGELIVYVDMYASEDLPKILELRFEPTQTREFYVAKLWGEILPTYTQHTSTVDRVFVWLPPLDEHMVLPIFLSRSTVFPYVFDVDFFILRDFGRSSHFINAIAGTYKIIPEGFHLIDGTVKIINHHPLPLRYKLMFSNTDWNATFYVIDPDTTTILWKIGINGTEVSINDEVVGTVGEDSKAEMDIGFSQSKLSIVFFKGAETKHVFHSSDPLLMATSHTQTSLVIESGGVILRELIVFAGSPDPTYIAGWQQYSYILPYLVAGFPKLNYPSRFKMVVRKKDKSTVNAIAKRTIGDIVWRGTYHTTIRKGILESNTIAAEMDVRKSITDMRGVFGNVYKTVSTQHSASLVTGTLNNVANYKLVIKHAQSVYDHHEIGLKLKQIVKESIPTLRSVRLVEYANYKMKITVGDPEGLQIIAKYPMGIVIDQPEQSIIEAFFEIVKKYYASVIISPREFESATIEPSDYGVEVNAREV